MFRHIILVTALCGLTTAANAQFILGPPEPIYPQPRQYYKVAPVAPEPEPYYYPVPEDQYFYPVPPQQYSDPPVPLVRQYRSAPRSDISYKCAQASEYIKHNNCGPQGCDIGLCIALQHGCRINHWGHSCPWGK